MYHAIALVVDDETKRTITRNLRVGGYRHLSSAKKRLCNTSALGYIVNSLNKIVYTKSERSCGLTTKTGNEQCMT